MEFYKYDFIVVELNQIQTNELPENNNKKNPLGFHTFLMQENVFYVDWLILCSYYVVAQLVLINPKYLKLSILIEKRAELFLQMKDSFL